jgi:hypothetical protein
MSGSLPAGIESLPQRAKPTRRPRPSEVAATAAQAVVTAVFVDSAPPSPPPSAKHIRPNSPPVSVAVGAVAVAAVPADTSTNASGWEYLDHPADVQIHAWGASIPEAFELAAVGMFSYMTPLSGVDESPDPVEDLECEGMSVLVCVSFARH